MTYSPWRENVDALIINDFRRLTRPGVYTTAQENGKYSLLLKLGFFFFYVTELKSLTPLGINRKERKRNT